MEKSKGTTRVCSKRYDLGSNAIGRVAKHRLLGSFIPLGNYGGGPGVQPLLVLGVLHTLGKPVFQILIRFERQMAALYRVKERLQGK